MFFQVLSIVYASLGALIFAAVRFENGSIHLQSNTVNSDAGWGVGGSYLKCDRISGVFVLSGLNLEKM